MEKVEDDADDDEEEKPLSERALNLESRVAQEERHWTIVAMDFPTFELFSALFYSVRALLLLIPRLYSSDLVLSRKR